MQPPILDLIDVSARSKELIRLHAINVSVQAGSLACIIGPNGSGKSTLLALMAADLAPTTGRVMLAGRDLSKMTLGELAKQRAVLTQETTVSFPFTVRDVVEWGRIPWLGTMSSAENSEIVAEIMTKLKLDELATRPVTSLSGGERKRVHIARVLAQKAPLLLLDEADSDLDLIGRQELDKLMFEQVKSGGSVVVVTHDARRIAPISDQVILMSAGRVHAVGKPSEVLTTDSLSSAFGSPLKW